MRTSYAAILHEMSIEYAFDITKPIYKHEGPDNCPTITCILSVQIENETYEATSHECPTRKEARQNAAQELLSKLYQNFSFQDDRRFTNVHCIIDDKIVLLDYRREIKKWTKSCSYCYSNNHTKITCVKFFEENDT